MNLLFTSQTVNFSLHLIIKPFWVAANPCHSEMQAEKLVAVLFKRDLYLYHVHIVIQYIEQLYALQAGD